MPARRPPQHAVSHSPATSPGAAASATYAIGCGKRDGARCFARCFARFFAGFSTPFPAPSSATSSATSSAPPFARLLVLCAALLAAPASPPALAAEPAPPFPQAQAGEIRWRIQLPAKADESQFKVELIPGKTALIDCNVHRLIGEFSEETLAGWGYSYYRLKSQGQMLSTRMACLEQAEKTAFVTGAPLLLPYNSRLPLLIYTPEGIEIRYRIWHAGNTRTPARE